MLIVLAGLPGVGKSSIASELARALRIPWLSVDPIEAAMLRSGVEPKQPTGLAAYVIAETIVDAQLAVGGSAIVDAVNAVEEARAAWRNLASRHAARLRVVECLCSDVRAHRRRLEGRTRQLTGLREPTWEDVEQRRKTYAPWTDERLVLDTAEPLERSVERVLEYVHPGPGSR